MKHVYLLLLGTLALVGCNHAEPEADLSKATTSFDEQRQKVQNDTTMPEVAKQSALANIDRMEAASKK